MWQKQSLQMRRECLEFRTLSLARRGQGEVELLFKFFFANMDLMQVSEKDIELKDENEIVEGDGRVYELGYLLASTITEENLPVVFGNLKELVSSLGGIAIADEMPKMIQLAYPMVKVVANVRNKFSTAYFGWVKFTMDSDKILELKKKLDLDPNFIRFLILKTVKENTIAAKRFVHRDVTHKIFKAKTENAENVIPINKEEIDKEIDALVEEPS
jgi:ribosomal protein S6